MRRGLRKRSARARRRRSAASAKSSRSYSVISARRMLANEPQRYWNGNGRMRRRRGGRRGVGGQLDVEHPDGVVGNGRGHLERERATQGERKVRVFGSEDEFVARAG